jgi:phosphopantetheinyl transferase (holo-ACP synthase)
MDPAEGVLARALVVLGIAEAERLLVEGTPGVFTSGELAYARSKSDPERRLAARLAAKRAVREMLGEDLALDEVDVVGRPGGPPTLRLSPRADARLRRRGGERLLLSLTHERRHAAAVVLLLAGTP